MEPDEGFVAVEAAGCKDDAVAGADECALIWFLARFEGLSGCHGLSRAAVVEREPGMDQFVTCLMGFVMGFWERVCFDTDDAVVAVDY